MMSGPGSTGKVGVGLEVAVLVACGGGVAVGDAFVSQPSRAKFEACRISSTVTALSPVESKGRQSSMLRLPRAMLTPVTTSS